MAQFNPLDYGDLIEEKTEFNPLDYGDLVEEKVEETPEVETEKPGIFSKFGIPKVSFNRQKEVENSPVSQPNPNQFPDIEGTNPDGGYVESGVQAPIQPVKPDPFQAFSIPENLDHEVELTGYKDALLSEIANPFGEERPLIAPKKVKQSELVKNLVTPEKLAAVKERFVDSKLNYMGVINPARTLLEKSVEWLSKEGKELENLKPTTQEELDIANTRVDEYNKHFSSYQNKEKEFKDILDKAGVDAKDIDFEFSKLERGEYSEKEKIQTSKDSKNYIERIADKFTEVTGIEQESKISSRAAAQSVIKLMAKEEGVPVGEYRQSPKFIGQAAKGFIEMATYGVPSAINKTLTGEELAEPYGVLDHIGLAFGSLGGLMMGPFKTAEWVMRPISNIVGRGIQGGKLLPNILKESLHDGVLIGIGIGLSSTGEALKETTFTDAAKKIKDAAKSGALTGTIFGTSRGLFPKEGIQKGARIITGLVGLNAQRAHEVGGNPFTDRPVGEVVFDIALDALFLWRGLPPKQRDSLIKVLEDPNVSKETKQTLAQQIKTRLNKAKEEGTFKEQLNKEVDKYARGEKKDESVKETVEKKFEDKVAEESKDLPVEVEKVEKVESTGKKTTKTKLPKSTTDYIDKKVKELGSITAVKTVYTGEKSDVNVYAREKAEELFGGDAGVDAVRPVEKVKKKAEDKFKIQGKGFDTQKGKVIPYPKLKKGKGVPWYVKKAVEKAAMKAGLDVSGFKVFEQDGGWVFQQKRSKWDGAKEFGVEKVEEKAEKKVETIPESKNPESEFGSIKNISEKEQNEMIDDFIDKKYSRRSTDVPVLVGRPGFKKGAKISWRLERAVDKALITNQEKTGTVWEKVPIKGNKWLIQDTGKRVTFKERSKIDPVAGKEKKSKKKKEKIKWFKDDAGVSAAEAKEWQAKVDKVKVQLEGDGIPVQGRNTPVDRETRLAERREKRRKKKQAEPKLEPKQSKEEMLSKIGKFFKDDPKSKGGVTLNSGVDPIQLAREVRKLGESLYTGGKQKYFEWQKSMKESLGKYWDKVKNHLSEIWKSLKKNLKLHIMNNRGSVPIPTLQKLFGKAPTGARLYKRLRDEGVNKNDLMLSGLGGYLKSTGQKQIEWGEFKKIIDEGGFGVERSELKVDRVEQNKLIKRRTQIAERYPMEGNRPAELQEEFTRLGEELNMISDLTPKYGPNTHPEQTLPGFVEGSYRERLYKYDPTDNVKQADLHKEATQLFNIFKESKDYDAVDALSDLQNNNISYGYDRLPKKSKEIIDKIMVLNQQIRNKNVSFKEAHGYPDNTMAHARITDRVVEVPEVTEVVNGLEFLGESKKITTEHLNEAQSDWHKRGQSKGYISPERKLQYQKASKATVDKVNYSILKRTPQFIDSAYTMLSDNKFFRKLDYGTGEDAYLPPRIEDIVKEFKKKINNIPLEKRNVALNNLFLNIEKSYSDKFVGGNYSGTLKRHFAYEIPEVARLNRIADSLKTNPGSVPNAPFKKTWHEMIMRDVITSAVKKGKDGVSWDTVETIQGRAGNRAKPNRDDIYGKKLVKFMKKESGVEPVKVDTNIGGTKDTGYQIVKARDGFYEIFDRAGIVVEPGFSSHASAFKRLNELVKDTRMMEKVWYTPITEKLRKAYGEGKVKSAVDMLLNPILNKNGSVNVPNLKVLGESFFEGKKQNYFSWQKKMKAALGELWDKVKSKVAGIWKELRKPDTSKGVTLNSGVNPLALIADTKKLVKSFGRLTDVQLGAISTRLGNIDPSIKNRMREYELDSALKVEMIIKEALPFIKINSKLPKEDNKAFDIARKNRDSKEIKRIQEKYGFEKEGDKVRAILDVLFDEADAVGYTANKLVHYHPREVTDLAGLIDYEHKQDNWSVVEEIIAKKNRKREKDGNKPLTHEEEIQITNSLFRGYADERITLSKPGQLKLRRIHTITPERDVFYADSNSALLRYINDVVLAIEAKRLFGTNKNKGIDLDNTIGAFILRLSKEKNLSPSQARDVRRILKARFDGVGTSGAMTTFKNLTLIDVMGGFKSAITQVGDIAWALYDSGIIESVAVAPRALVGLSRFTKEDLGVSRIGAEFSDKSKSAKAVDWVFKRIGLTKVDAIGKEILINSAYNKARKRSIKAQREDKSGVLGRRRFRAKNKWRIELAEIFGKDVDTVINDFANRKDTRNTRLYMLHKLSDFQPATLSELPEGFLIGGNWRILYMLKSFDIKKFDVYRREVFQQIAGSNPKQIAGPLKYEKVTEKSGPRIYESRIKTSLKGFRNLIKLAMFLTAMEATADAIKDLMSGRKVVISDLVVQNLAGFLISRYRRGQMRRDGVGSGWFKQIVPPFKWLDAVGKDIDESWKKGSPVGIRDSELVKSVPGGGQIYYDRWGKGKKRRDKKEGKTRGVNSIRQIKVPQVKSRKVKVNQIKVRKIHP